MGAFLSTTIIGLLIAVIGIVNMTGNISSLHWYHRQRVVEEDIKPFGKRVGFGTLLCGLSCIFFGVMFLFWEQTSLLLLLWLGIAGLLVGMIAGIVITLKAIWKYNKGLF